MLSGYPGGTYFIHEHDQNKQTWYRDARRSTPVPYQVLSIHTPDVRVFYEFTTAGAV